MMVEMIELEEVIKIELTDDVLEASCAYTWTGSGVCYR